MVQETKTSKRRKYISSKDFRTNLQNIMILEMIRIQYGLSQTALGARTGFYPQQIRHWFEKDDMKLSQLNRITSELKIKATPSYIPEMLQNETEDYESRFTSIRFVFPAKTMLPCSIEDIRKKYPEEMVDRYVSGGNTKIIADLIISKNDAITTACRKAKVNPTNLKSWFKNDDLQLSRLYAFAKAYGMRVHWELTPAEAE